MRPTSTGSPDIELPLGTLRLMDFALGLGMWGRCYSGHARWPNERAKVILDPPSRLLFRTYSGK